MNANRPILLRTRRESINSRVLLMAIRIDLRRPVISRLPLKLLGEDAIQNASFTPEKAVAVSSRCAHRRSVPVLRPSNFSRDSPDGSTQSPIMVAQRAHTNESNLGLTRSIANPLGRVVRWGCGNPWFSVLLRHNSWRSMTALGQRTKPLAR